jgi:hypothetical protein
MPLGDGLLSAQNGGTLTSTQPPPPSQPPSKGYVKSHRTTLRNRPHESGFTIVGIPSSKLGVLQFIHSANYVGELTIADRIRQLRADRAMTQKDLVARMTT